MGVFCARQHLKSFKQEDLRQVVMLEQNFTQSDWWVGFELSACEVVAKFTTTIKRTNSLYTQVDHWWTCIGFVFGIFLQNLFPLPCYLCIHSITLQQRCHIPFLPIGQHHAMAQAGARDTRDAELRSFSADGCGKKTMWWSNCNSNQVWNIGCMPYNDVPPHPEI